ncbi:MAG TPA: S8 family peptidase [Candidatus Anaerostipes avistercoris]|uniref:S8 family peptidase n=1 Tax=Candidatus Anaerostipes avistercoris TaxID=2838462 RepID=A0A9D2T812_9FIRM|nr:S8 family peptidase [uncultured Anaerostipes sp.]HJC49887.1 S8 family peptidase [Candidatus Anaerostipes avistercoris]
MIKSVSAQIHADLAHQYGFLGDGIGIAFLDTGLFPHRDFSPAGQRIEAFVDFVHHKNGCYDDNGHGTHITGIACSSGKTGSYFIGIAPKAHIVSLKVLNTLGNGVPDALIRGLQWVHDHHRSYHIRIVNISIGSPYTPEDQTSRRILHYVNQLWDDGLIVCIAGGNHGPRPQSISVPGNSRKIITVGSSDDSLKIFGSRRLSSHYSGRGPTRSCVMKPDVVAPGTNIYSCSLHNRYAVKSGTSMATPVVSGTMALLLEKYPYYTNKDAKKKLKFNCDRLNTPRSHQGWGRINVQKLLELP